MNLVEKKLDNGIPLIMEDIKNINTASLGIFVGTGSKNELEGEEGISHFIEHLLFKGTTNRTAKEISEEIDNQGGIVNAYTSTERTCYYVQMTSDTLSVGIDVLNDMFLNSTFTEENIDRERNVIIEEIRMYEDIPEEVVHEENLKFALNGVQGKNVAGTIESLKQINREKILKYFNDKYTSENIVIAVSGNIDIEKVYEQLNAGIGKLEDKSEAREYNGEMSLNSGEKLIKQEVNQVHLCVNAKGLSTLDDKKMDISCLASILGGNMSSRLFQKIREERGLAYSVYAYATSFLEGGIFTVYAGTTHEDYKEVIEIIETEFEDIVKNGVTQQELDRAKKQLQSSLTFGLENSKGRMTRIGVTYMLLGYVKPMEETIEEIKKVSLESIKDLARDLFDKKNISRTILGDI